MTVDFRRQLIVNLVVIAASVVVATILMVILTGSIGAEVSAIQTDRGTINQETNVLSTLSALKQQAPQAAAYTVAIDQLLPAQEGLIGFGDWLNTAAAADQVTVRSSFNGSPTPPTDSVAGQSGFSLQVNGSLSSIASFLEDIESRLPGFLLSMSSFSVSIDGNSYRFTGPGTLFFRP